MELFIIGLILYVGGRWLVKRMGADRPMFICRVCARITRGYEHCEHCVTSGDYEPPKAR